MKKRRRTLDDFEDYSPKDGSEKQGEKPEEKKRFSGPIKPGEIRNPTGRPKKADRDRVPPEKLQDILKSSGGLERIFKYLNYELPGDEYEAIFGDRQRLTKDDRMDLARIKKNNYQWAMVLLKSSIQDEVDRQRERDQPTTLAAWIKKCHESVPPEEKEMLASVEQKRKKYMEEGMPADEAWVKRELLELAWRFGVAQRQLETLKEERKQKENGE